MERIIGGRKWRAIQKRTMENEIWLMKHLHEGGIARPMKNEKETGEDFAVRLLMEIVGSGKVFFILAGTLIQEGMADTDWTPEVALETVTFFRKLTDEEDKAKLRADIVSLFIDFFEHGIASRESSNTASSAAGHPTAATKRPREQRDADSSDEEY